MIYKVDLVESTLAYLDHLQAVKMYVECLYHVNVYIRGKSERIKDF